MNKTKVDLLIKKILTSGASAAPDILSAGIDLDEVGTHGRTLLMAAASAGLDEVVETLVTLGASVRAFGFWRLTPLHEASANGHTHIALRLLELGAAVDAESDDGATPLMCAAAWGHIEVARTLLSHGADIDRKDRRGGTAADIADEKGEQDFVEFLDRIDDS